MNGEHRKRKTTEKPRTRELLERIESLEKRLKYSDQGDRHDGYKRHPQGHGDRDQREKDRHRRSRTVDTEACSDRKQHGRDSRSRSRSHSGRSRSRSKTIGPNEVRQHRLSTVSMSRDDSDDNWTNRSPIESETEHSLSHKSPQRPPRHTRTHCGSPDRHDVEENNRQNDEDVLLLNETVNLDDQTLKLLGEDPSAPQKDQFMLHTEVQKRWVHILEHGLEKPVREEVLQKHNPPTNCPQLKAPQINAEIASVMTQAAVKKDKFEMAYQNHLGSGITALGKIINQQLLSTNLANKEPAERENTLTQLIELGKILTDLFYRMSKSRRAIIIPNLTLNNNIKDLMLTTNPEGTLLFGPNLSEKIKDVKTLETMAKTIKPQTQGAPAKPKNPHTFAKGGNIKTANRNLNWKGPSRYNRGGGDQRRRGPTVPKDTRQSSTQSNNTHPRETN